MRECSSTRTAFAATRTACTAERPPAATCAAPTRAPRAATRSRIASMTSSRAHRNISAASPTGLIKKKISTELAPAATQITLASALTFAKMEV